MLRIPIPVFYVSPDDRDDWSVVDGVQRMSTIYDYFKGNFALGGLEYLSELVGLLYADLPRNMHRRISETQLVVNIIEPGTPSEVMYNIFHRINTGGMTLDGREIRHALNPGPVRNFLRDLAQTDEFLIATDNSIRKNRMVDRECALRFVAFYIIPWKKYNSNDLDGYLVDAMRKLNRMRPCTRNELKDVFKTTMKAASDIFGKDAFRKRYDYDDKRKPINKALLEAWSVGLATCSTVELKKLVRRRKRLQGRFIEILNDDDDFNISISTSTGTPKRVKKRFAEVESLIEECL